MTPKLKSAGITSLAILALVVTVACTNCRTFDPGDGASQSANAILDAAWTAHARGGADDAIPILERGRELFPADPLLAKRLANAYLAVNRPSAALQEAQRGLRYRPEHWPLLEASAKALLALGRREDAIHAYRRCIAARPAGYWVPWHRLGELLEADGKCREALEVYEDALSIGFDSGVDAAARRLRGSCEPEWISN